MNKQRISVTNALIIINAVVFLLGLVVRRPALLGIPIPWGTEQESVFQIFGAYSWFSCFMEGEYWRLITYQFIHANLGHIIFNMWALYFFGPAVEEVMGPRRFLVFYLICGISGALFSSLLADLGLFTTIPDRPDFLLALQQLVSYTGYEGFVEGWQLMPLVGASAAIYGVMVATAFLYPDVHISLLFPPVTMKLRSFAIAIIALATLVILFDWQNAGGEAGHLGGIIMGTFLMLLWRYRSRHASR